jgi:hypothetical protein
MGGGGRDMWRSGQLVLKATFLLMTVERRVAAGWEGQQQ